MRFLLFLLLPLSLLASDPEPGKNTRDDYDGCVLMKSDDGTVHCLRHEVLLRKVDSHDKTQKDPLHTYFNMLNYHIRRKKS